MRNFILLSLISAVVAIGCAPPDSGIEAFDLESIEGIKSALKQKTDEVSILQTEIKSLTAKLQTLDPTAKKPKVPVEVSPIEVETFESYST